MWQILADAVNSRGSTERAITSEKMGSLAPRQAADDELVGVVNHLSKLVIFDGAVELDGVPVALVEVVAGANRLVHGAQLERPIRVALEAHAAGIACKRDESEHPSVDLEHGDVVSKGIVLGRARQACTQIEHLVPRHAGFE
jgi:hypothetical protein